MKTSNQILRTALLASACLWQASAFAQEATQLPPVDVDSTPSTATLSTAPLTTSTLSSDRLKAGQTRSSDTAHLLNSLPGVSANSGGGFSSMPAIRGLNEQRLNILVDGHPIDSACPNDMNPPLSYTNPQTVGAVKVITGVSPVSMGGDSIGGVIAVESAAPQFATGSGLLFKGEASAFFRSNDDGFGGSMSFTAASEHLSTTYTGSYTEADNYKGGDGLGTVHSSEYAKTDHALALAWQNTLGLFELKGGYHFSPYEGFVNQYMDMTSNKSWFLNGHYAGVFDWGTLDIKADYRDTDHAMNFLADKRGLTGRDMPMNTEVHSAGYTIKADVPVSARDTIRLGHEYRHQWLNDYWPPVAGSMMMGPNPYINVNGATRNRIGAFAEWEARWTPQLSTLVGGRYDHVRMNTGDVHGYNGMGADAAAATAFNAASHRKRDNNWSASALLSYAPTDTVSLELGYAHKVRSPNIYERYSWGKGSMSSRMIGWFGDGNGYVGNLALKPERADTVSAAFELRGNGKDSWSLKVAPYYTHVDDYIDVTKLADLTVMGMMTVAQLQFVNQNVKFYGVDVSGAVPLWNGGASNSTRLNGSLSYVHGQNLSDNGALYHQMPLNAKVALEHRQDGLELGAELEWVAEKNRVDATRLEPQSNDYALLNLRTAYNWRAFRLSFDIENLFDKAYDLPLGGIALGDFLTTGEQRPVPGRGRSFNAGLSVRF